MNEAPPVDRLKCPYPGLRPFHFDESDLFFGRAEHVNAMLGKLEDSRFLAVVGSSGSGKSSLVRAGLLPALANGFIGGEDWRFIVTEPGNRPLSNLANAIHSPEPWSDKAASGEGKVGVEPAYTEVMLRRSQHGLVNALKEHEGLDAGPVVVLVDQFEELFRYQYQAEERERDFYKQAADAHSEAIAFVNLLLTAASTPVEAEGPEIYVILTMRTEYLKDCELFHGLPGAISDSQFLTPPMSRSQLVEAIEEPLRSTGAEPGKDLRHHILNDIQSARDQLPLMQHALMRAWILARARSEKEGQALELRSQDYLDGGGVRGAISNHGNEILKTFHDVASREIVRQIFVSLAQFHDDKIVRRPSSVSEIAEIAGVGPEVIMAHAASFLDENCSFLYVRDGEEEPSLDISHESVTRQWEVFKEWLSAERTSVDRIQYLADQARRREENDGKGYLLGVAEIPGYLKWEKEYGPTKAWAERHGGGFSKAMALLHRSFNTFLALFTVGGLAMVVVFASLFLVWKSNRDAAFEKAEKDKVIAESRAKVVEKEKELVEKQKELVEENKKLIAKLGEDSQAEIEKLSEQLEQSRTQNSNLIAQLEKLNQNELEQEAKQKQLEVQLSRLIDQRIQYGNNGEQAKAIEREIKTVQSNLFASSAGTTERITSVLDGSRKFPTTPTRDPKRFENADVEKWITTLSSDSPMDRMTAHDLPFANSFGDNPQAISALVQLLAPIRFFQLHYNARLRLLSVLARTAPSAWDVEMASQIRSQFVSILRTHNSTEPNSKENSGARIGPSALVEMAKINSVVIGRFPDVAGVFLFQEDGDPKSGEPADLTVTRTFDREIGGVFANHPEFLIVGRLDSNASARSTYSGYLSNLISDVQYPLQLKQGEIPGSWTVSYFGDDWKTTAKEWKQELSAQYGNQVKVYFPTNTIPQRQLAYEVQNSLVRAGLSPIEQAEFKDSGGSDGARVRYFREEDKLAAEKLRNFLAEFHGLKNCIARKIDDPDADPYSFHVFLAPDDSVEVSAETWEGSRTEEAMKLLSKIAALKEIESVTPENFSSVLKQFQGLRLIPETGVADDATLAELWLVSRSLPGANASR